MGSGYFPLDKISDKEEIEKLRKALELIEEVRDEMWDAVYGNSDQFDNAASDGGYLRDLSLAKELIERCIEK